MRKLRDILRVHLDAGLSIRQILAVTGDSIGLIQNLIARAEALGRGWPLPIELDDTKLQALFYPAPIGKRVVRGERHQVRRVMSMTTMSVMRCNPVLK